MYTYEHKTIPELGGEGECTIQLARSFLFFFFFLIIDSLCNQEQPKLLVKVPNKILSLHATSSEKESNAVFGFQELGHPFMRHRFVTSLFP